MDRVGIDVLQLPKSRSSNKYAVVFMTMWPEVYAVQDQSAFTIATEEFIPHHGIPKELLSDCGGCFLANLMIELYQLLGVQKLNTMAYHPQSDGLVE